MITLYVIFFIHSLSFSFNNSDDIILCLKHYHVSEFLQQSNSWFYKKIGNKFKRFGSAKIVRSLYKRKTDCMSFWSRRLTECFTALRIPVKTLLGYHKAINNWYRFFLPIKFIKTTSLDEKFTGNLTIF